MNKPPRCLKIIGVRPNRPRRRGAAMLEMAIVLPIFLMLVLGIIEMGRVMMIGQMATNGVREAARRAIVPGATHQRIIDTVNGYLAAAGVSETGRQVFLMNSAGQRVDLSQIGSHEAVTLRVRLPYSENTWGFTRIMGGKFLVAESTMRRE
jgi:hypothetical protein